ncbi:probable tubulin polyglutamylase TTLL9 [Conger conger]|uniref:probable tubulin polyglutamylase TTLL9 n=1 Tax=Conger conger TaxID=82655 RepID=UPI002A598BF2|nr:probable tubulin polyglutamylase TTLL9 [Conger conger]
MPGPKVTNGNSRRREGEGRGCVRYRCPPIRALQDVLRQRPGWREGREEEWDFLWSEAGWPGLGQGYLEDHMRVCHFQNHYELTRKNLLVKNLKRHRRQLDRDGSPAEAARCGFYPCTFQLPGEYHLLVEEFRRRPGSTWIMKPAARSQGKGIFLFRRLKDITDWRWAGGRPHEDAAAVESYVAQRYIEDPYLIGGRKFDLRVYVLVTSFLPLRAWLYRDGFARFSAVRFSLSCIDDQYAHLTNVAVQRTAPAYDHARGCKWPLQQLRRFLTARHGASAALALFTEMDNVFVRSLQSVQKVIINDKHCFQLYGYDIILDQDLKPWLIEVNASPSLNATCQQDSELKCRVVEDVLNVVDMEGRLTGRETQVGGFDLMWNDGPVFRQDGGQPGSANPFCSTNTNLGCYNDRQTQLRKLFKPLASNPTNQGPGRGTDNQSGPRPGDEEPIRHRLAIMNGS